MKTENSITVGILHFLDHEEFYLGAQYYHNYI